MNTIDPTAFYFSANSAIPNNPKLPVLLYRKIFDEHEAEKHKNFRIASSKITGRVSGKMVFTTITISIRFHMKR